MSYEPLHHKYRPQTFAQLVGQGAIAQTLSNALNRNKIAPAYLFTGPRGTGKTSSARILAKSLNCISAPGPTASPCGCCEVCVAITRGTALDVMELDAASHTGVDNIREIIERSQFAPVQCRYKVYVIDECHMLSTAAFNSLLKTLEEPPDRVVFVLATTDPQRVLPTIISRCQRFDFRRIPVEAMVNHLRDIAQKEVIAITDEAIRLVAQLSQGGLRDAESLLDQLSLLVGADEITEVGAEQVWDLVGSIPERDLLRLLEAIARSNPSDILDLAKTICDRGREPLTFLHNLTRFYRDLLIAKTAPQRQDLVTLTAPTWQQLCHLAHQFSLAQILAAQTHLQDSEIQIKNTTQPRLWLEVTLLGLLSVNLPPSPPTPTPADLGQTTNSPPKSPITIPAPSDSTPAPSLADYAQPPIQPMQEAPVTLPAVGSGEEENLWQQVIENLELFPTKILINKYCVLLKLQDYIAHIGINRKVEEARIKGVQPQLQKAFKKTLRYPVTIKFQLIDPSVKPNDPIEKYQRDDFPRQSPQRELSSLPSLEQERQKEANLVAEAAKNIASCFQGKRVHLPPELTSLRPQTMVSEVTDFEERDEDEPPF